VSKKNDVIKELFYEIVKKGPCILYIRVQTVKTGKHRENTVDDQVILKMLVGEISTETVPPVAVVHSSPDSRPWKRIID